MWRVGLVWGGRVGGACVEYIYKCIMLQLSFMIIMLVHSLLPRLIFL